RAARAAMAAAGSSRSAASGPWRALTAVQYSLSGSLPPPDSADPERTLDSLEARAASPSPPQATTATPHRTSPIPARTARVPRARQGGTTEDVRLMLPSLPVPAPGPSQPANDG